MDIPVRLRQLTSLLSSPTSHPLTENLFLRLLGLSYLAAFASLWPQILPLLGSHGIAPAARFLDSLRPELSGRLLLSIPTLFWFSASDSFLLSACFLECGFALVLISGWQKHVAAMACWILYLSVTQVGAPFLNFQWDALLLEAGFLAFWAGSPLLVLAYRFLLFRLMFESGVVKLVSADPNWRNLHALRFHFLTQPIPNPVAYYAYRLPSSLLDWFTGATFFIELIAPFLLFFPKQGRYAGAILIMVLQVAIILTGNYAFFNLLTLALCLCCFEDATFRTLDRLVRRKPDAATNSAHRKYFRLTGSVVVAFLMGAGLLQVIHLFDPSFARPLEARLRWINSMDIINGYGLFAVMTTTRPEIVLEGSNDGDRWLEYSFPYKPGELHRSLPFVAPYQPRLDWQMWFAALGDINENGWVGNLMYRIMTGDTVTAKLLDPLPFTKPPRYMRALLYDYRFTTPEVRKKTGAVWERSLTRTWFGPVSLSGR